MIKKVNNSNVKSFVKFIYYSPLVYLVALAIDSDEGMVWIHSLTLGMVIYFLAMYSFALLRLFFLDKYKFNKHIIIGIVILVLGILGTFLDIWGRHEGMVIVDGVIPKHGHTLWYGIHIH